MNKVTFCKGMSYFVTIPSYKVLFLKQSIQVIHDLRPPMFIQFIVDFTDIILDRPFAQMNMFGDTGVCFVFHEQHCNFHFSIPNDDIALPKFLVEFLVFVERRVTNLSFQHPYSFTSDDNLLIINIPYRLDKILPMDAFIEKAIR